MTPNCNSRWNGQLRTAIDPSLHEGLIDWLAIWRPSFPFKSELRTPFHTRCLKCSQCPKKLTPATLNEHEKQLYCKWVILYLYFFVFPCISFRHCYELKFAPMVSGEFWNSWIISPDTPESGALPLEVAWPMVISRSWYPLIPDGAWSLMMLRRMISRTRWWCKCYQSRAPSLWSVESWKWSSTQIVMKMVIGKMIDMDNSSSTFVVWKDFTPALISKVETGDR